MRFGTVFDSKRCQYQVLAGPGQEGFEEPWKVESQEVRPRGDKDVSDNKEL